MNATHLFELAIVMVMAIIALHYVAHRLKLPPVLALLTGGGAGLHARPADLHAQFDVVLEAVAAGRPELIRLHRAGDVEDETLQEPERDLDLEELAAISAKA